jgi:hypothetical protein
MGEIRRKTMRRGWIAGLRGSTGIGSRIRGFRRRGVEGVGEERSRLRGGLRGTQTPRFAHSTPMRAEDLLCLARTVKG